MSRSFHSFLRLPAPWYGTRRGEPFSRPDDLKECSMDIKSITP